MPDPGQFAISLPEDRPEDVARKKEQQQVLRTLDYASERTAAGFPERGRSGALESLDTLVVNLSARFNAAHIQQDIDTALIWAARNGRTRQVRRLLARRADIHAKDDLALAFAAKHHHPKTVKLLLEHGADPQVVQRNSGTFIAMLHTPTTRSERRTRTLLREAGAFGPAPEPR